MTTCDELPLRPTARAPRVLAGIVLGTALLGAYLLLYHKLLRRYGVHLAGAAMETAPLYGGWREFAGWGRRLLALSLGLIPLVLMVTAAWLAARWAAVPAPRWAWLLGPAGAIAVGLTMQVVSPGGWELHCRSLTCPTTEYWGDTWRITTATEFLRDYPLLVPTLSVHGGTHPPGAALLLHAAQQVFGTHIGVAGAVYLVLGSLTLIPIYFVARELAGPVAAMVATALCIATPSLAIHGPTADGGFALLNITAMLLVLTAVTRNSAVRAALGGVALAVAILFTYSTTLTGVFLLAFAVIHAVRTKQWRPTILVLAACGAAFVASLAALRLLAGFDIAASLQASMVRDGRQMLKAHYTLLDRLNVSFGNVLAFAIGAGLASVAMWLRMAVPRSRHCSRPATLAGTTGPHPNPLPQAGEGEGRECTTALLVTLLVGGFGGLYTMETERIWTFLTPLVAIGAAAWIAQLPAAVRTPATILAVGLLAIQSIAMRILISIE